MAYNKTEKNTENSSINKDLTKANKLFIKKMDNSLDILDDDDISEDTLNIILKNNSGSFNCPKNTSFDDSLANTSEEDIIKNKIDNSKNLVNENEKDKDEDWKKKRRIEIIKKIEEYENIIKNDKNKNYTLQHLTTSKDFTTLEGNLDISITQDTNKMILLENISKLNDDQVKIINYFTTSLKDNVNKNIIILGPAGTGKSFCIKTIASYLNYFNKNIIISTHQNLAAQNIDGITLHSLFGFNNDRSKGFIFFKKSIHIMKLNYKSEKRKYYTESINKIEFLPKKWFNIKPENNYLIIDEISMIGIEYLYDINNILQCGFNNKQPFGGINIICLGDFKQLEPIRDSSLYKLKDDTLIKTFTLFELSINQRQENHEFYDLCLAVRNGCLKSKHKKMLKSRLVSNFPEISKEISNIIHIKPTNRLCDFHNINKLISNNKQIYLIESNNEEGKECFNYLNQNDLVKIDGISKYSLISVGAKIMFISNFKISNGLSDIKICNGMVGTIIDIKIIDENKVIEDKISISKIPEFKPYYDLLKSKNIKKCSAINCYLIVNFENNETLNISAIKREIVFDTLVDGHIKPTKLYERTGYPIMLSWAVTTHKIQGITLNEAVIDMSYANFNTQQTYINISRVRDFEKFYITELMLPLKTSNNKTEIKDFIKSFNKN